MSSKKILESIENNQVLKEYSRIQVERYVRLFLGEIFIETGIDRDRENVIRIPFRSY